MTLNDLKGLTLNRVNTTQSGNIFSNGKITCLLKPTDRTFDGKSKRPIYYLSALSGGKSEYLSGMFATASDMVFSADFKDALGIKHIVLIEFADEGKTMSVRAA